jgi:hypothetical protein
MEIVLTEKELPILGWIKYFKKNLMLDEFCSDKNWYMSWIYAIKIKSLRDNLLCAALINLTFKQIDLDEIVISSDLPEMLADEFLSKLKTLILDKTLKTHYINVNIIGITKTYDIINDLTYVIEGKTWSSEDELMFCRLVSNFTKNKWLDYYNKNQEEIIAMMLESDDCTITNHINSIFDTNFHKTSDAITDTTPFVTLFYTNVENPLFGTNINPNGAKFWIDDDDIIIRENKDKDRYSIPKKKNVGTLKQLREIKLKMFA